MRKAFGLLLVLVWAGVVCAQIAVFPFEDLSRDLNGVNIKVSRIIAHRLEEQGFSVVGPDEVIKFLSKHHIMWVGWVDKVTADRIKRELGVQYILLGSILEFDTQWFRFGLVLRMVDAEDYKLIWAGRAFFSDEDKITFLGLGEKSWDFFLSSAVGKVLSNIPQEVLRNLAKAPVVDVARVVVTPRYARPGENVVCKAKVEISGAEPEKIFFVVDRVGRIPARKEGDFYTADWTAPAEEGRFGVSLEVWWDGAFSTKKRLFITTYYVDSTPPVFRMKLLGVKNINGEPVVARYVKIVPVFEKKEPVKRWSFKITYKGDEEKGEEARTVLFYSNMGDLPPWLVWRGKSASGLLKNGRYEIELTVWDRADNSYTVRKEVVLVRRIESVDVKAYKEENGVRFEVRVENYPLAISSWRLALWSDDGAVFYEREGSGVPKDVVFPVNPEKGRKLYYSLELVDEAGNRWKLDKRPLVITRVKIKKKKESGWVDDF